ncbi:MAG: TolC family protein [Chitinophagaceae bacterium]|nr:TolC family protein [Chitinophagaceae bacterium]
MKIFQLLILFVVCCLKLFGQQNTLSDKQLLELVRLYHPVVKQTQLDIDMANADITKARGAFNPIISNEVGKKTFEGKNYYDYFSPEISLPTWYGISMNAGVENLAGTRTDPTETLGATNFVGVSVPLAKNLLIDKRRAFLQQAKVMRDMEITQRRAALNDLYMEAMEAYWSWVQAYKALQVVNKLIEINETRLSLINQSLKFGERAAIDTTEALTQLQNFQYLQNEYGLQFQQAGILMSAFLWKANDEPYLLPETIVPSEASDKIVNEIWPIPVIEELIERATEQHPNLTIYTNKLDWLKVDKRLKFQELLPKLDVQYNALGKGYQMQSTLTNASMFENNFKYGLKFEMPLLLGQGRGEYRKATLKIAQTVLEKKQKQVAIQLKVRNYYQAYLTIQKQLNLLKNQLENYRRLFKAEEQKFDNGESSLFLVNSRENKLLETEVKLAEVTAKYYKTIYALQWSAGLLE